MSSFYVEPTTYKAFPFLYIISPQLTETCMCRPYNFNTVQTTLPLINVSTVTKTHVVVFQIVFPAKFKVRLPYQFRFV